MAIKSTAIQSNQYANRRASNAVDGNTITTKLDDCATATFDPQTNITWWQLDLGNEYVIGGLTFFVSTDGSNGRLVGLLMICRQTDKFLSSEDRDAQNDC